MVEMNEHRTLKSLISLSNVAIIVLFAHLYFFYIKFSKTNERTTVTLELRNGQKLPAIGLGTWHARNESELEFALNTALELGYRHFDTAYLYLNEAVIGRVLNKWISKGKLSRDELFIVTKLPDIGNTPEKVGHFLQLSLKALQLNYVDLYLMHSPMGHKYVNDTHLSFFDLEMDIDTDIVAVWKAMEAQVEAGLTRSIGLSNFNSAQLQRVVKKAKIPPAVLQVELHVYFQQKPLQNMCKKHNVTLTAYGPLGSPGRKYFHTRFGIPFYDLLEDTLVKRIAKEHKKTASQILLKFLLQEGIASIPSSANKSHLQQNLEIFDFVLTPSEMKLLGELDKGLKGRTFFPTGRITQHPEYPFNSF